MHFANSHNVTKYNRVGRSVWVDHGGGNRNTSNGSGRGGEDSNKNNDDGYTYYDTPVSSLWKYIHPYDKDQTVDVNGLVLFCLLHVLITKLGHWYLLIKYILILNIS